jgi:tRNA threonylcarbamoyladenosine biosynthesis protein TsaE
MPADLPEVARLTLPTEAATLALGEWLGRHLRAGDSLALVGDLGSGKTCLCRGLARGLGVDDPEAVCSPTYLLVVEHSGPTPLLHADAYLPAKLGGFLAEGGLDYLLARQAVVVVEWADRIRHLLPPGSLWLELALAADGGRTVTFRCDDPGRFPWLAGIGTRSSGG